MVARTLSFLVLMAVLGWLDAPTAAAQPSDVPATWSSPYRMHALHPAQSNGTQIGSIWIPAIGVQEPIRSGVAPEVIDLGVAHWAGTAAPGGDGNMVLAGHRTIRSHPFHDLDQLEPGHLIYVTDPSGFDVIYRVTETLIVKPRDIWITYDQGRAMLTMFACHPKGSQSRRIAVQADLVGDGRIV